VPGGSSSGARACRSSIVLDAGTGQGLFHAWFDIALGLAANGGQFRNHQVASALQHPLFTERERFQVTKIGQVLEHFRRLKNIAGTHLLGEILEAICY
jgi:hypothetical protein